MTGMVVNIDVDDLGSAVNFYCKALGLRLGRMLFDGTVAELLGAASPIQLVTKPAGSPTSAHAAQRRDYGRHWTPVHLDFMVDDVEDATHRARAAGATLEGDIQMFSWGRMANLSDPFGNGFCLIQLVGRGYGEVASR